MTKFTVSSDNPRVTRSELSAAIAFILVVMGGVGMRGANPALGLLVAMVLISAYVLRRQRRARRRGHGRVE